MASRAVHIIYFLLIQHLPSKMSINLAKCSCPNPGYDYLKVLQMCSEFHNKQLTNIKSLGLIAK